MLSFLSDGAVCRAFHPMVWNVMFFVDGVVCRAFHPMVWNVEFFCPTVRYVGPFI